MALSWWSADGGGLRNGHRWRITKEHLATVQRLGGGPRTASRRMGRPTIGATLEFEHASGASIRRDRSRGSGGMRVQTGLPFCATGPNEQREQGVSAGLLRHPGPRLATSGHFEGRGVYDLPLAYAPLGPGVRCERGADVVVLAGAGMPGTLGLANVVADAPVPINRTTSRTSRASGRGAKFLDAASPNGRRRGGRLRRTRPRGGVPRPRRQSRRRARPTHARGALRQFASPRTVAAY